MLCGIGFDKLKTVAISILVSHCGEDGYASQLQREIQLYDFPNREFDRRCG